ncbi:ribonuclease H-like domain-containing protein [Mycena leptocephala]|nr:ribonuclease H-like domain-containing protein [Mycena leptocephala]
MRGKPKLEPLDKLVIPCHSIKKKETRRVRCAGAGCHGSWAHPRSSTRILPHSSECSYLSKEFREEAMGTNAGASLGARVVDASTSGTKDIFAGFKAAGADNKAAARKARDNKTNFLTMNLLCDAGLPPAVVGNRSFRALVNHLDPNNNIKVASTFSSSYIPAEAARVTLLAIQELKKHYNLNLGYDGGTTLGQQSIYTVHVTTPDREPYFIKGDEASGFSHTGTHIKILIIEVMDLIGRERFASIGSDSTGNTKLGRELAQLEVVTVLIVPDPNHHLSNMIKDICVIEYFVDCIGKMRMIITYFSHSTYSATHLKALRVILDINKGREKIGKTRFGTLYWSSYSLLRCLGAIFELISLGIINVDSSDKDKSKLAWFKQLRTYQNFELELQQLTAVILEPIARAIKCLEGLEVTVGDIWKFYVAITAVLHNLFEENSLTIPLHVQDAVSAIVNRRYDEMIHGPSGDLFLSGFFLDPEHVKSPILLRSSANQLNRSTSVAATSSAKHVTDQDLRNSMPSYAKVGTFLFQVLAKELQAGRDAPAFARYSKASEVMDVFKLQFEAYTRQYPPFSVRSNTWSKAMQYWRSLQDLPESSIIAFVAIKIFSILGNSMPEERTVSRFTRTDTRDRANQDARTIVDQTEIYQHIQREWRATDKAPKLSKAPSLKWRAVKDLMTAAKPSEPVIDLTVDDEAPAAPPSVNDAPGLSLTVECQAGLTALNAVIEPEGEGGDLSVGIAETTLAVSRDGVDIRLPFFRDLLSDKPVPGADVIRSLAEWSGESSVDDQKAKNVLGNKFWDGEAEKLRF